MTSRDRILQLFYQHAEGYLSGEQICTALGISRAAVWKQIQVLRQQGYSIEGVASRGYRLLQRPDRLTAAEIETDLPTRLIGQTLWVHEETTSTNQEAHRLGEQNAPDGSAVFAERQTEGRGRMGRQWASPAGVNLYLSVLLKPTLMPQQVAQLTFASAVAVSRALEQVCDVRPEVKWPNDLLLNGKKVAGLLNEMQAESERVHYVVLGIGVNLNMTADQFPDDLRYPATSVLLETGKPVCRTRFARQLLIELDHLYADFVATGPQPMMQQWQQRCRLIGQAVQVSGGTDITGTVEGVDADGALVVRALTGERRRVLSGDVRPLDVTY